MGAEAAFQQMAILFFGILVGFAARRAGILDDGGCKAVTGLVMNVTLPFFIISSGFAADRSIPGSQMLVYFLASLACYAAAYLIGFVLSRLPLFPKKDRRLYAFMTTFGNTGFIGLPFIGALFGPEAVFYATIFNLPFNFLVFSIGVFLVSGEANLSEFKPKTLFNGCLVASILAIGLYASGLQAPELAVFCLDTIGAATVPLAMIITGASLGKESFKDVFANPCLYLTTAAKVLVVPLLSFCILSAVLDSGELVAIGTILMAMPVAANATLLCLQYGGNDRLASRGVFLSTLFSVATLPLLMLFLG